ncbi:hypothetical protein [Streptomyces caniscabiei]|uniref:hypothetical protein n=1 Tax=Streptomyces caniscabiei TaxID=2746961 RepID=UPI0015C5048E|nr:hypothetical protein [Streptomyces caniscabiei]
MRNIETWVPDAGQADIAGLRRLDADALARYVADRAYPWWRRVPCARALAERVPERHVAHLISRVRDPGDVAEVRVVVVQREAEFGQLVGDGDRAGRRHGTGEQAVALQRP